MRDQIPRPNDLVTKKLFDVFYQKRDRTPAVVIAESGSQPAGQSPVAEGPARDALEHEAFSGAIAQATQYLESHGEGLTVLDGLKVAILHRQDR
jgi:hypothetical protein